MTVKNQYQFELKCLYLLGIMSKSKFFTIFLYIDLQFSDIIVIVY